MNEQNLVPKNARWWAIACYLSGLMYLVVIAMIMIFGTLISQLLSSQNQNGLITLVFNLIPWLFWTSFLAPLLVWKLTKNIHPFTNSAGKTAWNLVLNLVVLSASTFLLTIFLWGITCGIMQMSASNNIVGYILWGALLIIMGLLLTHLLFSLAGAIGAWRGKLSVFPMLRFVKN